LQPALGHLVPRRAALRIVREGGHVLAFGGVAAEFLGGIIPETSFFCGVCCKLHLRLPKLMPLIHEPRMSFLV
jgi:hypothetical protein